MLNPHNQRSWTGSLAFVVASTALSFAAVSCCLPPSGDVSVVARRLCFALVPGLLLEAIRRAKLLEVRRATARADSRVKMTIAINGVEVGEIAEPLYAQAKLAAAGDPRNYLAQTSRIAFGLWHHAILAFIWTAFLLAAWLVAAGLLNPDNFARGCIAYLTPPSVETDHGAALATRLHDVARLLTWTYGTVFMAAAGVRMQLGASVSVLGAFRADLQRRVRVLPGTPANGNMSVVRTGRF